MSENTNPVEAYLIALDEPKQGTLRSVRQFILDVIPEAQECISYGMPAFGVQGKVIAAFAAFKNHLSYFPHSGSVVAEAGPEAAQYATTKATLRFPVDRPLPKAVVRQLVMVRLTQAFPDFAQNPTLYGGAHCGSKKARATPNAGQRTSERFL